MGDAEAMGTIEGARELDRNPQCLLEWQRPALEPLLKRLTVDELHDQKIKTVFMANVMERADVRMIERGDRARLTLESLAPFGIVAYKLGQNFDRDCALEA